MKQTFFTLFLIIYLSYSASASLLLGTKDLDASFQINKEWSGKAYLIKDLQGNPLEGSAQITANWEKGSKLIARLSYSQKDNLLDHSIFAKLYWLSNYCWWGTNLESRYALGYFQLPSLYSDSTYYTASSIDAYSIYLSQIVSNNFFGIDWYAGARVNLTSKKYQASATTGDYDAFSLSHFDEVCGASYKPDLGFGQKGVLSYSVLRRTGAFLPMDFFENQEIGTGIENQFLRVKYFYPLKFEIRRENYPFQDQRLECELHLPFFWESKLDANLIAQYQNLYNVMLSRNFWGLNAGIFASRNYQGGTVGLQVTLDQDNFGALADFYLSREQVPTTRSADVSSAWSALYDEEVNVPTLDQLVNVLTNPRDVCWYTSQYIDYSNYHNYLSTGWSKLYTPEEVFQMKEGNCTEQANLQRYILQKHGYQTAILSGIARNFAHSILAYKDPATGKWNAINNSYYNEMYNTQADTYEELMDKVYPGWLSIVVKGDNGKGEYEIDSTTKWYLQDWFEKE